MMLLMMNKHLILCNTKLLSTPRILVADVKGAWHENLEKKYLDKTSRKGQFLSKHLIHNEKLANLYVLINVIYCFI